MNFTNLIAGIIQNAKRVPSGTLYLMLQSQLTLEQYRDIIETLKRTELITEENNVLIWVG